MQESIVVGVSGVGFGCASNATIDAQMNNACVGDDENNDGDELVAAVAIADLFIFRC